MGWRVTIKHKLIGILLIPLLAFTVASLQNIRQAHQQVQQMQQIQQLAQLVVYIGDLVHESQKERGHTAGFLGSQGQRFKTELAQQRGITDQKAQILERFVAEFDLAAQSATFQRFFAQATQSLAALAQLRTRVDSLNATVAEGVGHYTRMHGDFLSAVSVIANSEGKALFLKDILYFSQFLKAKERIGIERAVMSATFARDAFSPGGYARWVQLMSEQQSYLAEFTLHAPDVILQRYEQVQGHPSFAEVLSLREVARSKAETGGFGVQAEYWFKTITQKIDQFKGLEQEIQGHIMQRAEELQHSANINRMSYTLVVLLLLGLTIGFGYFILRSILQPINRVVTRLRDIAEGEGDLTQRVDIAGKDELALLARWFNSFIANVQSVVSEVRSASTEVAATSEQIAASGEQMSNSMASQAEQVNQVVTTMQDMRRSIDDIAQQCSQATNNASASGELAQAGGAVVGETISGMQAISQVVRSGAEVVSELGQQGDKIGEIISVINDIAAQTNLLALNAAIEAARAGEHGRGFAVVADEVRKLAERTTEATEQVAHSIEGIQAGTTKAVSQMQQGTDRVDAAVEKAGEAEHSLRSIVDSASEVAKMIHVIAQAVDSQAQANERINTGVQSIASVSTQTQQRAQESAQATIQLSSKAAHLQSIVGQFNV